MTNHQPPQNYRSFSIEQKRDGSFSLYRFGYVAGHFTTVEAAKVDADRRVAS